MAELVEKISVCVERGKMNQAAPFPPDLKGEPGADELTAEAIRAGASPGEILDACMLGMDRIGEKFGKQEAFVPELLMSAQAMNVVMKHLEPFFQAGEVKTRGTLVIGTVAGDLHDIGKNLVCMVVKGAGWSIVDLGVDVADTRFLEAARKNPGCVVGMSALLTTTMESMEKAVRFMRENGFEGKIVVGGAPVTVGFARQTGADGFGEGTRQASLDPHGEVLLFSRTNAFRYFLDE